MYLILKPSAGPGGRLLLENTPTLNGTVVPGKLRLAFSVNRSSISKAGKAHVFLLCQ